MKGEQKNADNALVWRSELGQDLPRYDASAVFFAFCEASNVSRVLASVGIFVDKSKKEDVLAGLYRLTNVEEIYDVAGEFDILSIVSASGLDELRETLQGRILKIQGVKSAITNIILQPHKTGVKPQSAVVH